MVAIQETSLYNAMSQVACTADKITWQLNVQCLHVYTLIDLSEYNLHWISIVCIT